MNSTLLIPAQKPSDASTTDAPINLSHLFSVSSKGSFSELAETFKKLAEEGMKPLSIDEIMAKFCPSFPFKVKKVAGSEVDAHNHLPVGAEITINGLDECQIIRGSDFIYQTDVFNKRGHPTCTHRTSRQWSLV